MEELQYLTNLGFPAVMCLILLRMNEKQDLRHKEVADNLGRIISDNTNAIIELRKELSRNEK